MPTLSITDPSKTVSPKYDMDYSTENNDFPAQKKPIEMIFSPLGLENYMETWGGK